jgi:hypothetical protein
VENTKNESQLVIAITVIIKFWIYGILITVPFWIFDELTGYRKYGADTIPKSISELISEIFNGDIILSLIKCGFAVGAIFFFTYGLKEIKKSQ